MKKNLIALMMVLAVLLTLFAGCGTVDDEPGVDVKPSDTSKAQLTVATWDGGLGSQWLKDAAEKFEELYKDATNFEEGKTGVEINIVASRSFDGSAMAFTPLTHDVYFVEGVDYVAMINNKQFADITDVMTEPLTAYGESGTIAEKLDPSLDEFLTCLDGNYYAVPFYETFYSFAYDLDLWDAKSYYFAANGGWTNADGDLAPGPDGISGTSDDGMPATYEDFGKLITRIKDTGVLPFLSASNAQDYVANLLYEYYADYEGYDQMMLGFTFDGTATDLIDVSADGTVTKLDDTVITTDNAYMLTKQAGRYEVLQFAEDVILSSSDNYKIIDTHTNAQKTFIRGGIANDSPVAMIIEGTWWENEAKSAFADLEDAGYERHNYAVMPMPKASEEKIGEKTNWLAMSNSYGFIANNTDQLELAKEFLKFLHTDENLSAFTGEVNMTRALNYEILPEDQAKLTTYTKSILELKENSDIIYPVSTVDEIMNNSIMFNSFGWAWNCDISGYEFKNPWLYFKDEADTSAETYFAGLYNFYSTRWSAL